MIAYFRTLARQNRLANHRLHGACLQLSQNEFRKERVSFFPSLWATLNHILIVDWYYLAALRHEKNQRKAFANETPFADMPSLAEAQKRSDEQLIGWLDAADDAALDGEVRMERTGYEQVDKAGHMLMHLMTHQIHHRGQAHAMLSGTAVKPPQLDEFIMPSDAQFRENDLRELGWTEADLFR